MKAINATPAEIRKVFSEKYVIPPFQRPYSWEKDHCEKLWEDIIDFHENKNKSDKYFLGNIVLHPSEKDENTYSIIDGQQRLTTLLILIKALHVNAVTVTALEECLKVKDRLTAELVNTLRIESLASKDDKAILENVILKDDISGKNSNIVKNFIFLRDVIEKWRSGKNNSSDEFNKLILSILDSIVLLPIHCESEDDALTIFETINNRGMSLSDADIFKSMLYANVASDSKQIFIDEWNSLNDHLGLFRTLMHIRRAEEANYSKETALRSFFDSKSGYLKNVDLVVTSLKTINKIEVHHNTAIDPDVSRYGSIDADILWKILAVYPNYYWKFPLFVFLHKHGKLNPDGEFELQKNKVSEFDTLIKETIVYFFIKSIAYNSVNAVKDTTFRVCAAVASEKNYLEEYEKNINVEDDRKLFLSNLNSNRFGQCQRGIVLLSAYLNPKQDRKKFRDALYEQEFHIEHILPQRWADNNDWDKNIANQKLNSLGNLIPFEKPLNISATNAFFGKKKEKYRLSIVQDALDLLTLNAWTATEVEAMQEEKVRRLCTFFRC